MNAAGPVLIDRLWGIERTEKPALCDITSDLYVQIWTKEGNRQVTVPVEYFPLKKFGAIRVMISLEAAMVTFEETTDKKRFGGAATGEWHWLSGPSHTVVELPLEPLH